MPLAKIRIYAGTTEATTLALDIASTDVVRYENTVTVPLAEKDGFFVVLVEPGGRGDPVIGQPDASFTNPLLYDTNGDATWSP